MPKRSSHSPTTLASSKTQPPKGWPADIIYLTAPVYSPRAKQEPLAHLTITRDASTPVLPSSALTASSRVRILPIHDPAHPAHGQHGLFAAQHLPADSFILLYVGFVHVASEADANSSYDLSIDREFGIAVDATRMGNEARFINDYRGVRGEGANAEFRDCWIEAGLGRAERRMGVFVKGKGKSGRGAGGIAKGEEILVFALQKYYLLQAQQESLSRSLSNASSASPTTPPSARSVPSPPSKPIPRRHSVSGPHSNATISDDVDDDEQKLYNVNHQLKTTLTQLLNCDSVKQDAQFRMWVQCRLLDAEHALKDHRRRRSSVAVEDVEAVREHLQETLSRS